MDLDHSHMRIARPSLDLERAERFWTTGVGMSPIYRSRRADPANLTMVGFPEATWHIELTHDPTHPVTPQPTMDDALVLYLNGEVPAELIARISAAGGKLQQHPNPYWQEWGITLIDPDGYPLILSSRAWTNRALDE